MIIRSRVVQLVDTYRTAHVPNGHPLLIPYENGRALDRHAVTRYINTAGAAAWLGHIHPHFAIPWPPKPSTAA